jgi:hypothetical protein
MVRETPSRQLARFLGKYDRASEAVISVAVYPRWVSLFFLNGARLADPNRILRGAGARVRHVVLEKPADVQSPAIEALIAAALESAKKPMTARRGKLLIRSVSAKQRPRRAVKKD